MLKKNRIKHTFEKLKCELALLPPPGGKILRKFANFIMTFDILIVEN